MFALLEQHIVALVAGTAAAARRARAVFFRGETLTATAAILGTALLVGAILLPMFSSPRCGGHRYGGERGYGEQRRHCGGHRSSRANVRRLAVALLQYAQDNDERLPLMRDASSARAALTPYVAEERFWLHPWTGEPFEPNPALSYRRLGHIAHPEDVAVFFAPRPGWRGRRTVGFLDGHAERLPEEQWPDVKPTSAP
jgi:prepilin-type processing-associated H-X9-DG protein